MGEIQRRGRVYRSSAPVTTTYRTHGYDGQVIDARLVERTEIAGWQPRWETLIDTRYKLIEQIRRGSRSGEYGKINEMRQRNDGLWAVEVYRLRQPRPRWRLPAIIAAGVLSTLGAIGALGWWVATSISAALAGHGSLIVGALVVAAALAGYIFRRPVVEVIVKVW